MRTGERGFTVIEVLIAMAIALVVLAGALALYIDSLRGNAIAALQAAATAHGRGLIEDLRGVTIDAIVDDLGGGALPIDRLPLATADHQGTTLAPFLTVEEPPGQPELVRIHVDVEWTERGAQPGTGRDHVIRLETIRNRVDLL